VGRGRGVAVCGLRRLARPRRGARIDPVRARPRRARTPLAARDRDRIGRGPCSQRYPRLARDGAQSMTLPNRKHQVKVKKKTKKTQKYKKKKKPPEFPLSPRHVIMIACVAVVGKAVRDSPPRGSFFSFIFALLLLLVFNVVVIEILRYVPHIHGKIQLTLHVFFLFFFSFSFPPFQNNPIYIRSFGSTDGLRFHYIVHTSLDMIEEKGTASRRMLFLETWLAFFFFFFFCLYSKEQLGVSVSLRSKHSHTRLKKTNFFSIYHHSQCAQESRRDVPRASVPHRGLSGVAWQTFIVNTFFFFFFLANADTTAPHPIYYAGTATSAIPRSSLCLCLTTAMPRTQTSKRYVQDSSVFCPGLNFFFFMLRSSTIFFFF
jgi:hypothetical protein